MRGLFVIGLSVLVFSLPSVSSSAKIGNQPLVSVDGRVITVNDFRRMALPHALPTGETQEGPSPQYSMKDKLDRLDDVIFFVLAAKRAREEKLHKTRLAQEEMDKFLYWAYFQKHISPRIQNARVSKKQVHDLYPKYPVIASRHIFFDAPVNSPPKRAAAKAKADKIYAQLAAIKNPTIRKKKFIQFASNAKLNADPARTKGGWLGYLGADQALPHYYEAVKGVGPGEVTKPFTSEYGWHLAYVEKVLPASRMGSPYYGFLEAKIRRDIGIELLKKESEKLRKTARVSQVNRKLLERL